MMSLLENSKRQADIRFNSPINMISLKEPLGHGMRNVDYMNLLNNSKSEADLNFAIHTGEIPNGAGLKKYGEGLKRTGDGLAQSGESLMDIMNRAERKGYIPRSPIPTKPYIRSDIQPLPRKIGRGSTQRRIARAKSILGHKSKNMLTKVTDLVKKAIGKKVFDIIAPVVARKALTGLLGAVEEYGIFVAAGINLEDIKIIANHKNADLVFKVMKESSRLITEIAKNHKNPKQIVKILIREVKKLRRETKKK